MWKKIATCRLISYVMYNASVVDPVVWRINSDDDNADV